MLKSTEVFLEDIKLYCIASSRSKRHGLQDSRVPSSKEINNQKRIVQDSVPRTLAPPKIIRRSIDLGMAKVRSDIPAYKRLLYNDSFEYKVKT